MKPDLMLRTLAVGPWIAALLLYAGRAPWGIALAAAIALIWAAPLIRDRAAPARLTSADAAPRSSVR
ncbi:hypothetical protein Ade02nite_72580 [Paractinoplanes deccanensis]|uniref:Uncharacterized protein n=1 Tax=Paractinoplanes deccanensis TaxID=113561 RepID=A0ABQ3YF50_9ACTN|nr:hypothetical protein [Actinoplanes deccanensis]GID78617.1 hypothetical protein Ade02nite_72580 [Actinoplanes deccanensis]